jgi:ribosomal protein S3
MGQKVHPGGMRVGVIHDWKSNWYTGKKEFPGYLIEDIKIREHITNKLSHAGLSDILIRKDKQRITVDIYTARPGIVIGKSGVEVDALRKEERPHQHQRDQASGARREARRAVDRGAAAEPRQLPPRDEARTCLRHPLRREGCPHPVRRSPGRH